MKAPAFDYARPKDVASALKLLAEGGRPAAGTQSLGPMLNLRVAHPTLLVDIRGIEELKSTSESGSSVTLGACITHAQIEDRKVPDPTGGVMASIAASIAYRAVRNRGTIGGSLAHADPSADYPATILALDADIEIVGRGGSRTVKARDFFQGLFTVNLSPEEIIAAVHVTPAKAAAYAKLYQRASHYAIVGVAAALEASGGTITAARVGLTGATPSAIRLNNVEQALVGKPATKETVHAAATSAGAELKDLNDDIHASTEYRRSMVAVFARRALEGALARA